MKRLALLACCTAGAAFAADLSAVQKVYLLRMGRGFDQYLANRLTQDKVFQVVTDPKLADTVITDQIGAGFEAKLDELYPPPEEQKPAKAAKAEKADKAAKSKDAQEEDAASPLITDTVNKLSDPATNSSFGRARGMVFLVDAKTKQVVWSAYDLPKDATSQQLDRTASVIVNRIKKDLGRK